MKTIHYLWILMQLLASGLMVSCERVTELPVDAGNEPLRIQVSVDDFEWGQVPYGYSRASESMKPEMENSLKTLAILQFDSEGNLRSELGSDEKPYRFVNLVSSDSPQGILSYTLTFEDDKFYAGSGCTLCILANIPETEVKKVVFKQDADGNLINTDFTTFKQQKIAIPYVTDPSADDSYGLQIGHVKNIYMFGEYDGEIAAGKTLNIGLGRMISRLQINIKSKNAIPDGSHVYLGIANLEREAFFFHGASSPGNLFTEATPFDITSQTVNGQPVNLQDGVTVYFYAAPRMASNQEDATSLNFWYTTQALSDSSDPDYTLPLGNQQPGTGMGDYSLNRNTYYVFNLNLTSK